MKKLFLLVLSLCTLAGAPSALADTQELLVSPFSTTPGAKADTDIDVFVPDTAAPTAKLAVYVPAGVNLDLTGAVGAKVADAGAVMIGKQVGGTQVTMTGAVTVDDPAKYASDPNAAACDANAHAAVWLLSLTGTGAGQALSIPIFVDQTTGTDASLGAFVLIACFASPDVAQDQGGAQFGAQLLGVSLQTTGVVVNAPTGNVVWRAFITPYSPGTATVDPTGVVETRCIEPLPHAITNLKTTYSTKTKKVTITGLLVAGGKPRPGVHLRIDGSTRPDPATWKPWVVTTTKANGTFSIVKPLPKTFYAFFYVNPYFNLTCTSGASTAPKGCVREDTSPEFGPALVLKPKKK